MGRVYNAFVKAQQWDDRPSPMGPPAGRETDTEEISSFDFEDSLALAEEVAQPRNRRPSIAAGGALQAGRFGPFPPPAAAPGCPVGASPGLRRAGRLTAPNGSFRGTERGLEHREAEGESAPQLHNRRRQNCC